MARGGRKTIKGDETAVRLIARKKEKGEKIALELFGRGWLRRSLKERDKVVRFLLKTEEPGDVRREAKEEWGLNAAQGPVPSQTPPSRTDTQT